MCVDQVDNSNEFTFRSMDLWAYLNKVELNFSRLANQLIIRLLNHSMASSEQSV